MAVILAHPAAARAANGRVMARRPRRAARDIPLPPSRAAAEALPKRRGSLLMASLVPLLLASATADAVTFLGGAGAPALPTAHASASFCASPWA